MHCTYFNDSTDLFSTENDSVAYISVQMICHSSETFTLAASCWRGCAALYFSLKYPKDVLLN